jgi:hypothetical protein
MVTRRIKRHRGGKKIRIKNKSYKKQLGGNLCESSAITDNYALGDILRRDHQLYYEKSNPEWIIKKIGPAPYLPLNKIKLEIDITRKASELDISPKMLYSRICIDEEKNEVSGYIILEKIEGILLGRPTENQLAEIKRLMALLNENGIKHGDIHAGNFVYGTTASNPVPRVWLIDYGESTYIKNTDKNVINWNIWR